MPSQDNSICRAAVAVHIFAVLIVILSNAKDPCTLQPVTQILRSKRTLLRTTSGMGVHKQRNHFTTIFTSLPGT